MKVKTIISIILLSATVSVWAQDVDDIRSNPAYVWGQGFNENYQAADEEAVKDLISQIVVNVNSETETVMTNVPPFATARNASSPLTACNTPASSTSRSPPAN